MGNPLTFEAFITIMAAITAGVWACILLPLWHRSAIERGGHWTLDALLLICGPLAAVMVSAYPEDGEPTGMVLRLSQLLTVAAVVVGVLALGSAVRTPRKGAGGLLTAVIVFYFALGLSCLGGVVPVFPKAYWMTPLVVVPFVAHGGFTLEWLAGRARLMLRILIGLSLVAAIALPELAFNLEEARTVFGLSRLQGVMLHPNHLAAVAVVGALLEMHARRRMWLLVSLVALLLAQSTTGWVALAVAVMFLSGRVGAGMRRVVLAGMVGVSAVYIVAPVKILEAWAEIAPEDVTTLNGRTLIWDAALRGYEQNPLFGYGPTLLDDAFRARYLGHFDAAAQAHNQAVQTLGDSGLVGAGALLMLFLALWVRAARAWPQHRLPAALLIALAARCVTETPLRPTGAGVNTFLLVVTLGIAAAASAPSRDQDTADTLEPPRTREGFTPRLR